MHMCTNNGSLLNNLQLCFSSHVSSTAMEKRNAIFREAVKLLMQQFPNEGEDAIDSIVLKRLPSAYLTYNTLAQSSKEDGKQAITTRANDLEKACHGFPLHLPDHVVPCRDGVTVTCNATGIDNQFRR